MAFSNAAVWSRLRDARGPRSSTTRPLSIASCTLATTRRSPSSATRRSRNSSASGVLVIGGRHGARPAADRRVALVEQRVVGHVVVADVAGHVIVGPHADRIDLDEPADVAGHEWRLGACRRLAAAQPAHPRVLA